MASGRVANRIGRMSNHRGSLRPDHRTHSHHWQAVQDLLDGWRPAFSNRHIKLHPRTLELEEIRFLTILTRGLAPANSDVDESDVVTPHHIIHDIGRHGELGPLLGKAGLHTKTLLHGR